MHTEPLAVRYFEIGPEGLFRGTEFTQEIHAEDIARPLDEPRPICKGSRISQQAGISETEAR